MATTGPFNGTNLLLYVAGIAVAYSKTCTLSRNVAMIDTTTKDSGGDMDSIPGLRDWSISVDGLVALDSITNAEYFDGLITGRTLVNIRFGTDTSADGQWDGSAYVESMSMEAPMEGEVSFSGSLKGTGALVLTQMT